MPSAQKCKIMPKMKSLRMWRSRAAWVASTMLFAVSLAHAQQAPQPGIPGFGNSPQQKQFVSLLNADAVSVAAGKPTVVEIRFRVNSGLHVHSHKPSSELYIPTELKLQPESGVTLKSVDYPAGQSYAFSFEPKEKLSVYTGDFTVKTLVMAQPGSHMLSGTLRYQACDAAACFPPRNLPVNVVLVAK